MQICWCFLESKCVVVVKAVLCVKERRVGKKVQRGGEEEELLAGTPIQLFWDV